MAGDRWRRTRVWAGIFLAATAARSDTAVVGGSGGTAYLLGTSHVRLEAETVDITIDGESISHVADVRQAPVGVVAVFHLKNLTTSPQRFKIGFPELTSEQHIGLRDFRAYVDGKSVSVVPERAVTPVEVNGKVLYTKEDEEYVRWFTWTMSIPASGSVVVKTTYRTVLTAGVWFHPSMEFDAPDLGMWWMVNYVLKTGASWAGPIGSIRVTLSTGMFPLNRKSLTAQMAGALEAEMSAEAPPAGKTADRRQIIAQPAKAKIVDGRVVWEMKDLEPDEDITLMARIANTFDAEVTPALTTSMVRDHPDWLWSIEAVQNVTDYWAQLAAFEKPGSIYFEERAKNALGPFGRAVQRLNEMSPTKFPTEPRSYLKVRKLL